MNDGLGASRIAKSHSSQAQPIVVRYQLGLKDFLILPLVGIAAVGVNSALNYVLYDLERWWLNFLLDSVESTNVPSQMPGFVMRILEVIASRGVDMTAVAIVALLLVFVGRATHSAALLLIATMPFSPQIGFDAFSFYFLNHQWVEGWPELAAVLIGLLTISLLAVRVSGRLGPRAQLLILIGFVCCGALGLCILNPSNYGPRTLQSQSTFDGKTAPCAST